MMADVTWSATDSGNVQDTHGTVVGTADGAGNFTITSDVEVGWRSALPGASNDTLTIGSGVTVKMAAGLRIRVNVLPGVTDYYGTLIADGTVFTSNATSPAAGDWRGIEFVGNTIAESPALYARVRLTGCTMEYMQTGILSQNGAGEVSSSAICIDCTFRKFSVNAYAQTGGYGWAHPEVAWWFVTCCFAVEAGDIPGAASIALIQNAVAGDTDKRVYIHHEHCSWSINCNSAGQVICLNANAWTASTLHDCILHGTNAGAGDVDGIKLTAGGISVQNANNFINCDNTDGGGTLTYSPHPDDQEGVDPSYTDETYPFDLSPDAQAGDPDLYVADQFGGYVGAKEPYNYPASAAVDPDGTTGVWAEFKQRVYECSFGSDANMTLGRAIRIKVSSTDLAGPKHVGGMFLRVNPERLK